MATVPYCNRNGTLVDLHTPIAFRHQHVFIGVLYCSSFVLFIIPQALCFLAICHKKHLQYSCYKLMFFVSFLDMMNLFVCLGAPGILSLFRIDHCQIGYFVVIFGRFLMLTWYSYCAASMILAFNRCLEFTYAPLASTLFEGSKAWFWIIPICVYAGTVEFTTPNAFYFYARMLECLAFRLLIRIRYNHVANNFGKFVFLSIAYFIMWCMMKMKTKGLQPLQYSAAQRKLSVQALLVGVFAALSTLGYIAVEYLPLRNVPLIGMLGSYSWASAHVASAVIYISMNKSIRTTVLQFLHLRKDKAVSIVAPLRTSTNSRK
ncbi:hypothetical protein L596_020787 [Steinernema carpocapsae]|uniref:G-protein coupled receptors family 1 profile domain-containing protein n=1 Tax=Steinernema carpocapsae TaxID=34508 RepID=A0A4U5MV81_STECR|nr:hypothetical protein L596_020787 [Steinernema carpocapsae]